MGSINDGPEQVLARDVPMGSGLEAGRYLFTIVMPLNTSAGVTGRIVGAVDSPSGFGELPLAWKAEVSLIRVVVSFWGIRPSRYSRSRVTLICMELCLYHPRFRGLFWAQTLGALNDNIFKNALVILVLYRGWTFSGFTPATFSALVAAIFMTPFLLFSAPGGQLADRMDKADLVRKLKSLEVVISVFAAVGLFTHSVTLLLVALAGYAAQSAYFGPVKYAILPQILEPDELLTGNALVETATSIAILLGTIGGGLLAARSPVHVALVIIVCSLLGRWAASSVPSAPPTGQVEKVGFFRSQVECLKLTWQTIPMLYTILGISWFWMFGAAFIMLIPIYSKELLGGSEQVTTYLVAAFSIGIGIGSQACEKLSRGRLELGWVPIGGLGMTLFALDFGFRNPPKGENLSGAEFLQQPGTAHLLLDLVGLAVSAGLFIVPLYTFLQKRSQKDSRSRLIAGSNIWNGVFMVGATLILGACMEKGVTLFQLFVWLAVANLVVSILAYRRLPEFTLRLFVVLICKICYRLRVRHYDRIPAEGACLLIANHVTLVDWLFLASGTDRPARFVMLHTYYNIPILHYLFRDGGAIPIGSAKTHPELVAAAFERIHEALANEEMVIMFPEGKLTTDGQVDRFRKGVEQVLERDPVPVLPVGLKGLWGTRFSMSPERKWHFRPPVEMVVGEMLPAEGQTADGLREQVLKLLQGPIDRSPEERPSHHY
jgi:1-acyl-sn-glycerol-3-phosphate acyltransferase